MNIEKHFTKKKAIPFLLIGLLIFILYIYFFVGVADIVLILQRVNIFIYSLAFISVLLNTAASSLAWQHFLRSLSVNVPFRKSFLYMWVGTFIDILVPAEAISGEISKAYLMSKSTGENTGKVVASIVSHRLLSGVIMLGSLLIGSTSLLLRYKLPGFVLNLIIIVTTGTILYLIFLSLVCIREQIALKIIDSMIRVLTFIFKDRWNFDHLRTEAHKTLKAFHQGIKILGKHPKDLVRSVIFSIAAWLFSLLISFLVFVSLGQTVPLSVIVIVHSISSTVQTIPLGVPGEVGIIEILMTSLYTSIGISLNITAAIAAAATVLIRVVNMWFRFLIGFIAIQLVGINALKKPK
ncbi:flippase-like domain-containing protein [Candidatus Bathyarchaeota archaeon]|nr:flippase-like domain-containing protein [Candidatus Bathyarchaeota archaeon]